MKKTKQKTKKTIANRTQRQPKPAPKKANDDAILNYITKADRSIGDVMTRFQLTRVRAGLALERLRNKKAIKVVGTTRAAVWTLKHRK